MITLTVRPDGGEEYDVTATSRDVLVWEKTSKGGKTFLDLVREPTLVDLYRVAHIASWRQGLFPGTLQEFESGCEVLAATEAEEVDPTRPGLSPDNSSTSPSEPASPPRSGQRKASAR